MTTPADRVVAGGDAMGAVRTGKGGAREDASAAIGDRAEDAVMVAVTEVMADGEGRAETIGVAGLADAAGQRRFGELRYGSILCRNDRA